VRPPLLGPQAFSLAGCEAIVTEATKGVSAAVALALARAAGANVAMLGRDPEGLAATEVAVRAEGRECWPVLADFATTEGGLFS
jgi:NAD(P)-dependent dehydrogenase (short-subunit alcohol dehydrogenase family)